MLESYIQQKIRHFLEVEGWMVIKIISSSINGIPDLIAHKDGRTMYIETKREGRDLDPVQRYRQKQLIEQGIPCFKADSIKELMQNMLKFKQVKTLSDDENEKIQ